jgi:hypothetical protein
VGFAGVFEKKGVYVVVFLWSFCGGLFGERGEVSPRFPTTKNTPQFGTIFCA